MFRRHVEFRLAHAGAATLFASCLMATRPEVALAAPAGTFATVDAPGGGHIITGALGADVSLPSATAAMLRRVHAEFGSKPTIVQAAQNNVAHSLALMFTDRRSGRSYTGISIVTAVPGNRAGGAVLYDTSARFHSTLGPMMKRLQSMTTPSATGNVSHAAAAEPLIAHAFGDGTGSIGVPADWKLTVAGGGSATALGPTGEIVGYNVSSSALDPTYRNGQNYLNALPPQIREAQMSHTALLAYSGDPVRTWTTMFDQLAKQHGKAGPNFQVKSATPAGEHAAEITGTGHNPMPVTYVAYVAVTPPNGMGQWSMVDTFVLVPNTQVARQGATAAAILQSVRINFGAFAAQGAAIRAMFQKQFDSMIANGEAQNDARAARTDEALANDRATQESMHKQAVSMENYSLDRAVVVNTTTGAHSTVDTGFADALVQGDRNYEKVPANRLLRGVDY